MYNGIDYGHGITNIDLKTGLRYGVISIHPVLQAWSDESEGIYDLSCPECETDLPDGFDTEKCPDCGKEFDDFDFDFIEPIGYVYNQEGYQATQGNDDSDIFVIKSPYYTYAQFCSPCAPGACHLENPIDKPIRIGRYSNQGNACYCFGHDWFDDGKAPYTVYSVETGRKVES